MTSRSIRCRNNEGLITPGEFVSDGLPDAVGEQFDNYGSIQNDHRSSLQFADYLRSSTPGWNRLRRCVSSNHSRIVGRSATRSGSLLMKSERLMPSRAARDFSVPCRESGTSRTCIILDMLQTYSHVQHMSTLSPRPDRRQVTRNASRCVRLE